MSKRELDVFSAEKEKKEESKVQEILTPVAVHIVALIGLITLQRGNPHTLGAEEMVLLFVATRNGPESKLEEENTVRWIEVG